ncbi:hypothetical protein BH09MYX1_BH09MYX1_16790 [soil metagenome]
MLTLSRAALSGLLLVGSVCLVVACSDDPAVTPTPTPKPVCPDTVPKAVGSKCTQNDYSCGVGFFCPGGFAQQATCTCNSGTYECKTSTGTDIPAGTTDMTPFCIDTTPAPELCPATTTAADFTTCKTPGKICYYTGKVCPENSVQLYDVCMCRAGVTDSALGWLCEINTCAK